MNIGNIVLLLAVGFGHLLAEICPPDWHRYGESCYVIITQTMDWYEANHTCARAQANLAVPNSQSEQDYIKELFLQEVDKWPTHWIGCNDVKDEGKWQHCPLKGDRNAYENWSQNQPDNTEGADCAVVAATYFNGQWDDVPCSHNNYAVCELPVSNTLVFCLQTGNDGRLTSQCLFNHVMKELPGKGFVSCGKACRSDPGCRSFNLLEQDGGKMVCQLNNATRHEAAEGDMQENENCYFFNM